MLSEWSWFSYGSKWTTTELCGSRHRTGPCASRHVWLAVNTPLRRWHQLVSHTHSHCHATTQTQSGADCSSSVDQTATSVAVWPGAVTTRPAHTTNQTSVTKQTNKHQTGTSAGHRGLYHHWQRPSLCHFITAARCQCVYFKVRGRLLHHLWREMTVVTWSAVEFVDC